MATFSVYGSIVIKTEGGEHSVFYGKQPIIPAGHKIVNHSSGGFEEMEYPWKHDVYCELELSGEGCSADCRHWLYYCGYCASSSCGEAGGWVYLEGQAIRADYYHDNKGRTVFMWCLHRILPAGKYAVVNDSLFRVETNAIYLLDKRNPQKPKVVKKPADGCRFTITSSRDVCEHTIDGPENLYDHKCCDIKLPNPCYKVKQPVCGKCGKKYTSNKINLEDFVENKTWVEYPEAYKLIRKKERYRYDGNEELSGTAMKLAAELDSAKKQIADMSVGPRCKCGAVPKYVYACGHCVCEKCEGSCHCGGPTALRIALG
jgi:hypothetical protein